MNVQHQIGASDCAWSVCFGFCNFLICLAINPTSMVYNHADTDEKPLDPVS